MSGQSVIELQIALINQIRGTWAGLKDPSLPARRFNFSFTRDILTRAIFQGGKHYSTFDIHFDKWFLVELAKDFPQLNDFLEEVDLQNASRLSKHNFTCPPEMLDAVQFILKNKYSRVAQKHMLENKVKEILIAALETSANDNTGTKEIKLTAADKEKLEHAKTLIELQPVQSPLSLQQLCRKVGLNEYKLKKGFKQLHGFSPYDYHVRRKIEEAKRLLVDTNDTITGIAYAVGYNHVQNFDIEFKKRVGCPPNHFRKYGNTRN